MKNLTLRRVGQWLLVSFLLYYWVRTLFFKDTLFDFEACCPFGGLQAATTFVANSALACTMGAQQVIMAGMLVLSTILVSKLFCGHICPIGTISEGLGRLGKRFKVRKFEAGGIVDILLRSLKYGLLFTTFYFTLQSNDLFCKKFDPFFASVTLFGTDVSAWMATLSILLLVVGAVFYKQFWCRYLCPLGAISNAFKYFYVFIAFALILTLLHQAKVEINLVVILASVCIIAYVLEIIGLKKRAGLQILRITRNPDACIECGLCDKKCPQGIQVSKMKTVNHPDCNLCTECMGQCPHNEDAIGINGKAQFSWLPTLITVVFIMAGFVLGTNTTIPTVDFKWGDNDAINRSAVFEMSGIKNVKCYGSSISFVDQMKKVKGITGAATFVHDHRVKILYDTTMMSKKDVRKALFTPSEIEIRQPKNDSIVVLNDLYIQNFFDQLDLVFLANLSKGIKGVYGFKTFYGEPVKIRFFTSVNLNTDSLKNAIEGSTLIYKTPEESFSSKGLYTVSNIETNDTTYSGLYYKSLSFPAFRGTTLNRKHFASEELTSVTFAIKRFPKSKQYMSYLINHLGYGDSCIVGMVTKYTQEGPVAIVYYAKDKTNAQNIANLLFNKTLSLTYSNGKKEDIENPFVFKLPEGLVMNEDATPTSEKN